MDLIYHRSHQITWATKSVWKFAVLLGSYLSSYMGLVTNHYQEPYLTNQYSGAVTRVLLPLPRWFPPLLLCFALCISQVWIGLLSNHPGCWYWALTILKTPAGPKKSAAFRLTVRSWEFRRETSRKNHKQCEVDANGNEFCPRQEHPSISQCVVENTRFQC